jgi:hypothetical protein
MSTGEISIFLNKKDSSEERLTKLKIIKNYLHKILVEFEDSHYFSHEFLFPKDIDLKKYLVGIIFSSKHLEAYSKKEDVLKLIKKKYGDIKIYEKDHNEDKYPKLLDVLC